MDLVKRPLFHLENKLNPERVNLDCFEREKERREERRGEGVNDFESEFESKKQPFL